MDVKRKKPPEIEPRLSPTVVALVALSIALFFYSLWDVGRKFEDLPYSEFLNELSRGNVVSVAISDSRITGELKSPTPKGSKQFITLPVNDPSLVTKLRDHGVTFRAEPKGSFWAPFLAWLLPGLVIYWLMRGIARPRGGMLGTRNFMGLTRAHAKVFVEKDIKTTFADVAGIDEAKEELKEIVEFLSDPQKYTRLGGRAPRGVLLVGPPGTGKTLLARALAGEAKVPFLSINGSEFVEMFVGLGAARVRDLFVQSRELAPCILFIDEIDALGRARGIGVLSGGNEEKEQTLNQLLAEMDGFDTSEGVIILAATNRPEILDPALLRAGRFDRQVLVPMPDQNGRTQILKVHARKITLDSGVKLEKIAALTPGFSGADLANLVNEAALSAVRRNASAVSERDFTAAIERIVAGIEQKSKLMNPDEKRRIAYHEMGHATAALSLGTSEKVHKVSIIPRGLGALGYTLQRPTEDRYLMEKEEMVKKIAVLLAGRASETLQYGSVSTGAADDLSKATDIAHAMVTQYGMSEKLGLATFEKPPSPFLPGALGMREPKAFSEETARDIDREVKALLDESYRMALERLDWNRTFIEAGVERLISKETIDEEELVRLWSTLGAVHEVLPAKLGVP